MVVKFKDIEGKFAAVELLDGSKVFGNVIRWSRSVVWVDKNNTGSVVDIPKDITQRILILM